MESFIDVTNLNYCGKEGREIFSKDLFSLDLRGYGITYMDNVKGRQKIYSGELGDLWQEYTCAFTPDGEVALSEDYIEPAEIKINLEECYDKFWDTYLVEQTEISLNGGIPQSFSDWFFAKLRAKMAAEYQEMFFKGDTGYTGTSKEYLAVTDGIEKKLSDATGSTKITGSTITIDNAISQVEAVVLAGIGLAADGDYDMSGWKVFMNYSDAMLLEVALGKLIDLNLTNRTFNNYGKGANGHLFVMGIEIIPTMQSRGTIIFGPAKNLVLGFDTYDSHIQYKLIDLRNTTGDNAFRVLAISNIAVGIVFPELFVISKP